MKTYRYIGLAGSTILGVTAWVTIAFANPAMLPDHPGHPMKPLKDPVKGQSLANDPGRSQFYEQEALNKAAESAHGDLKLRTEVAEEIKMKEGKGLHISSGSQK